MHKTRPHVATAAPQDDDAAYERTTQWLDDLAESNDDEAEVIAQEVRDIGNAVEAARAAEAAVEAAVLCARRAGASWNNIALPLGVSRQAARQRYARLEE